MPGPYQIILIVVVIVLLFGSRKLPDLARALRQSIDEFKKPSDSENSNQSKNVTSATSDKDAEIKELERKLAEAKSRQS